MYARPARLSLRAASPHEGSAPPIPGGSPLKARYARASDCQGYFQHNSATERSHIDLLKHVHFFYKNSHLFRIFPTA